MRIVIFACIFLRTVPAYALTKIPGENLDVIVEEDIEEIPSEVPAPTPESYDYEVYDPKSNEPKTEIESGNDILKAAVPDPAPSGNTVMPDSVSISRETGQKIKNNETAAAKEIPGQENQTAEMCEADSFDTLEESPETGLMEQKRMAILVKLQEVSKELYQFSLKECISYFTRSELYDNSKCDIMTEKGEIHNYLQENEDYLKGGSDKWLILKIASVLFAVLMFAVGGVAFYIRMRQQKGQKAKAQETEELDEHLLEQDFA